MNSRRWLGGASLALLCLAFNAQASGLQVSPIRLEFAPADRVQALTIGNRGDVPMQVQLELNAWSQNDGQEQLRPSRALLATPPQLRLEAGEQRVVRVGRRQLDADICEHAFRLIVTEILPQAREGAPPLRFRARMVLPVFVRDQKVCEPDLQASRESGQLILRNLGNGHAKLFDLELVGARQSWPLDLAHVGYLLPGAWQAQELPADVGTATPVLRARTQQGVIEIPLRDAR